MNFLKLKHCIDEIKSKYNTPGIDCSVYKNHQEIFRYFIGKRDVENNIDINGSELYTIYSMTKMLTCVCALQLYEKGCYSLDEPVSKYLPEYAKMKIVSATEAYGEDMNSITSGINDGENYACVGDRFAENQIRIKDLFTMGAGLNYDLNAPAIKNAINNGKTTTRDIVAAISETVLAFEPGTGFKYSLCHDVLGALIEIWSGKRFGKFMEENLLEPLSMTNTFFETSAKFSQMSAKMIEYKNINNHIVRCDRDNPFNITEDYESGGAGLISSVSDYAVFLDALACGGIAKNGKKILEASTIKLMSQNHLSPSQYEDFQSLRPGYGYGLGVRTHVDKEKSKSLSPIGEFGWDGAAGSFSMVDTKNKISLTYFQEMLGWSIEIQSDIRNSLYKCIEEDLF